MSLSLDGATAATHDGFRGVHGVFAATLDAAQMIRGRGLRLEINTTVTQETVSELPDILRRVIALDASLWSVFFLVPTGRGERLDALNADDTEDVLHWLHETSRLIAIKTTEAPHYLRVAVQRAGGQMAGHQRGPLYEELRDASADLLRPDHVTRRRVPRPPLDVNAGKGFVFVDHVGAVPQRVPATAGRLRTRPSDHRHLPGCAASPWSPRSRPPPRPLRALRVPRGVRRLALTRLRHDG